jgi:hypothetical protein
MAYAASGVLWLRSTKPQYHRVSARCVLYARSGEVMPGLNEEELIE